MIQQDAVGIHLVEIIGIAHVCIEKIFTPNKGCAILAVLPGLVRMTIHIKRRLIGMQHIQKLFGPGYGGIVIVIEKGFMGKDYPRFTLLEPILKPLPLGIVKRDVIGIIKTDEFKATIIKCVIISAQFLAVQIKRSAVDHVIVAGYAEVRHCEVVHCVFKIAVLVWCPGVSQIAGNKNKRGIDSVDLSYGIIEIDKRLGEFA